MKLECFSFRYIIDGFKANFKKYQINNSLLICAGYYQTYAAKRISNQLLYNNISNKLITYDNGLGISRGNNNLVLLIVELGTNLRLHDPSYDGGYKNELKGAIKLAGNQTVYIVVLHESKYTINTYRRYTNYVYIDIIDNVKEGLLSQEIMNHIKMYFDMNISINI